MTGHSYYERDVKDLLSWQVQYFMLLIHKPRSRFSEIISKRTDLILPTIQLLLFWCKNCLLGVTAPSVQNWGPLPLLLPFPLDGIWVRGRQRWLVGRSEWVLAGLCSGGRHPALVLGACNVQL